MNKNGIIIQEKQTNQRLITDFQYNGISVLPFYPLLSLRSADTGVLDRECLDISNEVFSKRLSDGMCMSLEFISSYDLFSRYVSVCKKRNIPIRALFIESDYEDEIWDGDALDMHFLGYEFCPIPIDDVIVYDIQYSPELSKYKETLNGNGLFGTFEQALEFQNEYMRLFSADKVGDGEMVAYICKVFEIHLDDYP